MIKRYQKKPVVTEAAPWDGTSLQAGYFRADEPKTFLDVYTEVRE